MTRLEMIKALTQNELDWIAGDPTHENIQEAVEFFSKGGFTKWTNEKIETSYKNLTA